ncbi:hypothetical protein [Caulobacter sp.]|uniref:hypothetical protein n=1 Tax=Caulobacter sp. TaxID=78 RepID=UPI001B2F7B2A|nr:hypothetical protein [Caulobacter sp.]MBO9543383.1 hypothetical protein [Caulobacter sp.]
MRLSSILTSLAAAFTLLACASGASAACTATSTATSSATYSPNAVTPVTPSMGAGFGCAAGSPLWISFSGNYVKATITTSNGYKVSQAGAPDINYVLSADAAGTKPLSGTATYYVNGTSVDLANLIGFAPTSVPVYIKPTIAGAVKSGVYTGTFTILWDWSLCSLAVGSSCIGVTDKDTKSTIVTVNLTISGGKPATVTTTTTVVYDDKNGTTNPKSIPGSKQRTTVTVSNPDTSALASNTMELKIATPAGTSIALDGDGAGGASVVFTEGSPASGLAFTYTSSTSLSDDVEFSSDGGSSWLFLPTAATQAQVTHIRLKPRGAMAAGSNFKIAVAYTVK